MKRQLLLLLLLFAASGFFAQNSFAQQRQIRGTVTDHGTGNPLPDVSVVIRGTNTGTRTDENGKFQLSASQRGKVELEVSLIGYGTQIINPSGTAPLAIAMDKQAKSLDEVVVIGYGTVTKKRPDRICSFYKK